jgi:serine-type D-Ala-D-Ala carboxypeptidase/endopeptidase (penicillin-binding protein 4)
MTSIGAQLFRLNTRLLVAIVFTVCTLRTPAQLPPVPTTVAELQQWLSNHIAQPRFAAAMWGVKVVSLDSGKTLFEHNPEKLFSPASNSKLYTVALALDRLGTEYRIKTSLYSKVKPNTSGVLKDDLVVYGRGDPTITARLHGDDIHKALEPLVTALTNAGVRRIAGDLVGDESYFRGPPFGSGWAWDDMQYYYGAEISALTINDNTLQTLVKPGAVGTPCKLTLLPATAYLTFSNRTETVQAGRSRRIHFYRPLEQNVVYVSGQMPADDDGYKEDLTIHNPAGLFVWYFKQALAEHGIKVSGTVRTRNWLDQQANPVDCHDLVELGSVESLPMRDMAREVMKPSQNLYTDLLLAHVGEKSRAADQSGGNSEDLGIRELEKLVAAAGIKSGDVLFEEGSGLSRNNLTTPNATIGLLQFAQRRSFSQVFFDSLPVAGVDGTLRNRMKGTAAAGNVRAKTGTLRWANALSGQVTTAAGERLIFSIMLNRYHNSSSHPARPELDAIAIMLASLKAHSSSP